MLNLTNLSVSRLAIKKLLQQTIVLSSLVVVSPAFADCELDGKAEAKSETKTADASATSSATSTPQVMGDAIPKDATVVSIEEIAKNPANWQGKKIAIEGNVVKMCKTKGCWFNIGTKPGEPSVLVTSSKYNIFLNQGSEGKKIVAFGVFSQEKQSAEEAAHFAKDAKEAPPKNLPLLMKLVADGAVVK